MLPYTHPKLLLIQQDSPVVQLFFFWIFRPLPAKIRQKAVVLAENGGITTIRDDLTKNIPMLNRGKCALLLYLNDEPTAGAAPGRQGTNRSEARPLLPVQQYSWRTRTVVQLAHQNRQQYSWCTRTAVQLAHQISSTVGTPDQQYSWHTRSTVQLAHQISSTVGTPDQQYSWHTRSAVQLAHQISSTVGAPEQQYS
jgi:hypothetical protein